MSVQENKGKLPVAGPSSYRPTRSNDSNTQRSPAGTHGSNIRETPRTLPGGPPQSQNNNQGALSQQQNYRRGQQSHQSPTTSSGESYCNIINQFPTPSTHISNKVPPRTSKRNATQTQFSPGASMDDIELQNIADTNPFTSARGKGKCKASADTGASNNNETLTSMASPREARPERLTEENLHRQTIQAYHDILRVVNGLQPLNRPPRRIL